MGVVSDRHLGNRTDDELHLVRVRVRFAQRNLRARDFVAVVGHVGVSGILHGVPDKTQSSRHIPCVVHQMRREIRHEWTALGECLLLLAETSSLAKRKFRSITANTSNSIGRCHRFARRLSNASRHSAARTLKNRKRAPQEFRLD